MQNNRKRILTMLENGNITTDEALTLLEKLNDSKSTEQSGNQSESKSDSKPSEKEQTGPFIEKEEEEGKEKEKENNDKSKETSQNEKESSQTEQESMDDFLNDLRRDFSNVGDRFMQFMQNAVQKVKTFDFESPFGQSITFDHSDSKPAKKIEDIVIDIDNGKVTVHCEDGEKEVRADFSVKAYNGESEEKAREEFLNKLIFTVDEKTLRVYSDMKMKQVNVDLYLPKKQFNKLSANLMNGTFKMKDAEIEKIRVKTANGKIDLSGLKFKNAEFDTMNGSINFIDVSGETVEAEALNGRVYIDGKLMEVDAQSLNGSVVVTTTDLKAKKIDAKTMSGSVEIYIPQKIALSGEISSNIGKLDLQLDDVDQTAEQEQILQRSIRFKKDDGEKEPLLIFGEAKTGSVLVCYSAKQNAQDENNQEE